MLEYYYDLLVIFPSLGTRLGSLSFGRANLVLGFKSFLSGLSERGIWNILGWVGFGPLRGREFTTRICRRWLGPSSSCWERTALRGGFVEDADWSRSWLLGIVVYGWSPVGCVAAMGCVWGLDEDMNVDANYRGSRGGDLISWWCGCWRFPS